MKTLFFIYILIQVPAFSQVNSVGFKERKIIEAYDECAGNDSGTIGNFDVENFDVTKEALKIREYDKNRHCFFRNYSHSKMDAKNKYYKFIFNVSKDPFSKYPGQCLKNNVSSGNIRDLNEIMTDKTNLAIISSTYDYSDPSYENHSEGCAYYHFYIYRKNGTVMRITFDYTD